MRTVINLYIGNLAAADVIIAVFCIPFQFQASWKTTHYCKKLLGSQRCWYRCEFARRENV